MSSRLLVKVCGMRDRENIAQVATYLPDYMGFIFVPHSPRYVGDSFAVENIRNLPSEIKSVGVFQDSEIENVVELMHQYEFSAVQLHGKEDAEYLAEIRHKLPGVEIIKAISCPRPGERSGDFKLDSFDADIILVDGVQPGSGQEFDWGVLDNYHGPRPLMVAGGVGIANIKRVLSLRELNRWCVGIDLNSKVESAPGIKDLDLIHRVFKEVR